MPRTITLSFNDGSTHVYQGAPDDITPEQVSQRAAEEFPGLSVTNIDGGKPAAKPKSFIDKATDAVAGVFSGSAAPGAGRGSINPPTADPSAPRPSQPRQPKPYVNRLEALDDAVNLVEEGADPAQVSSSFGRLGIQPSEIEQHGMQRGSQAFQRQTISPQDASRAIAAKPSGSIKASPAPRERTALEAVSDTGLQLKSGVYNLAGAVPQLVAPEGDAAQFFQDQARKTDRQQSGPMRDRMAIAESAISEAGQDGLMSQMAEAAAQYFSEPALAARFVATNLPSMVPGIGAAKVAQVASLAKGLSAASAARNAVIAGGAVNAALNAGGARGESFDDIKRTLVAQGMSDEAATEAALRDSRVAAAVGAITGALSGATGLEGVVAKSGSVLAKGGARKAAKEAGIEFLGEQLEEVAPKVATNIMAGQYDNRPVTQDVGRTIVETAIGSAPGAAMAAGGEIYNDPTRQIAREIDRRAADVGRQIRAQTDPSMPQGGPTAWDIARSKGFNVEPPTPADKPSVRRSKAVDMLTELGAMAGLPKNAIDAALRASETKPVDALPGFFARFARNLHNKGVVQIDPDVLAAMESPYQQAATAMDAMAPDAQQRIADIEAGATGLADGIENSTGEANGQIRDARQGESPAVQNMAEHQGSMQQPEEPILPQLRREGYQDSSGMGGQLLGIPGGSRGEAISSSLNRQDQQQRELRTRERSLANEEGASSQPTQESASDIQRQDAGAISLGGGVEYPIGNDLLQAESTSYERQRGAFNTAQNVQVGESGDSPGASQTVSRQLKEPLGDITKWKANNGNTGDTTQPIAGNGGAGASDNTSGAQGIRYGADVRAGTNADRVGVPAVDGGQSGRSGDQAAPSVSGAESGRDGVAVGQPTKKTPKARKHPPLVRGSGALAAVSRALGGISPKLLPDLSDRVERTRRNKKTRKTFTYITWDNPGIPGWGPLFREGGSADLSEIARVLQEDGYLEPGSNERDPIGSSQRAEAIIRAELKEGGSTIRVGDADAVEARAQQEAKAYAESQMDSQANTWDDFTLTPEELAQDGYTDLSEDERVVFDMLMSEALDAGIDVEDIKESLSRSITEDTPQNEYHQALKQAIVQAIAQAPGPDGQVATEEPGQGGDGGSQSPEQGGKSGSPSQERDSGPDAAKQGLTLQDRPDGTLAVISDLKDLHKRLVDAGIPAKSILKSSTGVVVGRTQADKAREILQTQTEADLKAKAERETAAEKEQAAAKAAEQAKIRKADDAKENKARADATVDDFQLGQTADQQMAGMGDLFSQQAQPVGATGEGAGGSRPTPAASIQDVGEKIGGARKDTATSTGRRGSAPKRDERPGWMRRYDAMQSIKDAGQGKAVWHLLDSKTGRPVRGQNYRAMEFGSEAEAQAAIPLVEVARNHRVSMNDDGRFVIKRDVSDRKRVQVVQQAFATGDEAMQYMRDHAAEIIETKTSFGEEILPKPERVVREGSDRRKGDIKGEDFIEDFGLRGVEFGNWNNQEERQEVMNHAFDALHDLADVMGVPPKALGLGGQLGLAFGARGHGLSGARAHYEVDYGVINLTKMSGAGSLAHEWFHALDHYLARQDGKAAGTREVNERGDKVFNRKGVTQDMATHGFKLTGSQVRPELRAAYENAIKVMFRKAETYVEDLTKAEEFIGATKADLAKQLQAIRDNLSKELDKGLYRRNFKPATAEQLAEFDGIAERLIAGESIETKWQTAPGKGKRMSLSGSRWTNDALEQLSAIIKAVRGRSGFNAERTGTLDSLRNYMERYSQRLKMLAEAQNGAQKVRMVPTDYAMGAKEVDQGRASDYWTTPHEMAARAFESYVQDQIEAKGGSSDFLVYGTRGAVPTPWGWAKVYPEGEERAAINKAFDAFLAEVKTKEDDAGNVVLFSLSSTDNEGAGSRATDPLFRLDSPDALSKVDTTISRVDLAEVVQRNLDGWRGIGIDSIVAADDWRGLPPEILQNTFDQGLHPRRIEGVYFKGKVYLVRSALRDKAHAEELLFHEAVGHLGTRLALEGKPTAALNELWTKLNGLAGVAKLAKKIQLQDGKTAWDRLKPYVDGMTDDQVRRRATIIDELIAFIAQSNDTSPLTKFKAYMADLKGAMVKLARKLGLDSIADRLDKAGAELDVIQLVRDARQAITTGKTRTGQRFVIVGSGSAQPAMSLDGADTNDMTLQRIDGTSKRGHTGAHGEQPTTDSGKVARLSAIVGKALNASQPDGGAAYIPVSLPELDSLQSIAQAFGKSVVGYRLAPILRGKGSPFAGIGGVSVGAMPGTIFINEENNRPHISVLGHELAHEMRRDDPQAFAELVDAIRPFINQNTYRTEFAKERVAKDLAQAGRMDAVREEFIGEVLSDGFTEPAFWNALGEHSPSLLSKVVGAVGNLIDRVRRTFGEQRRTGKYLTDFDRVMEIAGKAMARYAQSSRAGGGQGDGILFSLSAPDSPQWALPEGSKTDNLIYELQDGRIDLKRVQEAILSTGKKIEQAFDARLQETLFPGRVAIRSSRFLETEVKPLLDTMARNNVTMNELSDFLHARGAKERNAQIAKVNPDLPDGGAGTNTQGVLMTDANAQAHLDAIRPVRRDLLSALAKRVDALTAGTRKLLVDEGLESQDVISAWEKAYPNYIPMFRDEAEAGNPHPIGTGMSVRGGASKRATGSTKEVTNILAHVLMQREAAITRAEKNRVAVALYGLALTNPNKRVWATIRPGMSEAQINAELIAMGVDPDVASAGMEKAPTIRTVDEASGRVVNRLNPIYKSLPGAVVARVKGEDRVLMLNQGNERALRMAQNLKNMDGLTKIDLAGSIVGRATRWMASINTAYNPAFGLVNVTRDALGAAVNLSSTPLRGKSTRVLLDALPALQGVGREIAGLKSGEWGRLYRQFQEDGGQTGYRDMFMDANARTQELESAIKALDKRSALSPRAVGMKVLDALEGFNTTLENGVRVAAYKTALDQGMSRPEAARLARELTVDFNRKGRMTRELGPLYAFFNASVQGSARTVQALRGPAGKRILLGGLTLGVLQSIILAAAGYDEDEMPEFVKARAFIIPLGADDKGEKRFAAIPLPLGLHVIPNTGRVLAELAMSGGERAGERAFNAVGEIAGAFNPLGGGNIFTLDGALKTVAPTVVDPLIELAVNKNFAGVPIERQDFDRTDTKPGHLLARERTLQTLSGQTYTEISKLINKATGGDDFEAGMASPTPERVRYIAQVAGGGLLREIEKVANAVGSDEPTEASDMPLLGRFYGRVDNERVQESRYYENLNAIEAAESIRKRADKAKDKEKLKELEQESPEVGLYKDALKVKRDLNKAEDAATSLTELDAKRLELMAAFNKKVKDFKSTKRNPNIDENGNDQ